ncbi:hypothetical protein EHN46_21725 [Salmonella enterica]|nr:hypothetical protein [Salmonella enterica]EBB7908411.1 hypothetical protein [Salmonella enterica]EBK3282614.1 hypothetical protein [Salmonella enterica]ECI6680405.1 hypothetical protein [Salmonella enterica subsp. enterica]
MNYSGNEELRQDIAVLSNDMSELHQQIKLLEQKYRWSSKDLTQNLAGQTIRIVNEKFTQLYRDIYELDLVFSD